jgi:hypothetical protein
VAHFVSLPPVFDSSGTVPLTLQCINEEHDRPVSPLSAWAILRSGAIPVAHFYTIEATPDIYYMQILLSFIFQDRVGLRLNG